MPTTTTDRHARGGVAKLVANASALSTPQALLSHLNAAAGKGKARRRCCKPASSTRRQRAATRKGRSSTARRPVVQARR